MCAALAMSACTVQQTAVMDKIRDIDNVGSYRLPLNLLSSVIGDKASKIPGLDLSALQGVRSVDVLTAKDPNTKDKVRKLLNQFYKGNTYELLLEAKENRMKGVSIYGLPVGTERYSELIMIVDNGIDINILQLNGTMSRKDLKFL